MSCGVCDCKARKFGGASRAIARSRERCAEASEHEAGVHMSKIPQGEWSAIAARYAKGESITRIAQSYGCTPPAIHYILKRGKQRAAENAEQRLNVQPDWAMSAPGELRRPTMPAASRAVEPRIEEHGGRQPALGVTGSVAAQPVEQRPVREATTLMA